MQFAEHMPSLLASAFVLAALVSTPVAAQTEFSLTQEKKPAPVTWQQPALFTYVIDTEHEDYANVQASGSITEKIALVGTRRLTFGPVITWNRNSQVDARQNNLEVGAKLKLGYRIPGLLPGDVIFTSPRPAPKGFLDPNGQFELSYARTAAYPDLKSAECVASPGLRQCNTQMKESVRSTFSTIPYWTELENNLKVGGKQLLGFSLAPGLDVSYDHLVRNKVNTKTGVVETGGYLSAAPSATLLIAPSFDAPRLIFKADLQLRYRMYASSTREPGIERSAIRYSASFTYYFVNPPDLGVSSFATGTKVRAGASMGYSKGADPLSGKPAKSLVTLGFTIGFF